MTLQEYLDAHDLTVAQFAEKTGMEESTVHRAYHGKVMPSPKTVEQINRATRGAVTILDLYRTFQRSARMVG